MEAMRRHALVASLFTGLLLAVMPHCCAAAVPEVALDTDPFVSLQCLKLSVESLRVSGATTSATHISAEGVSLYQAAFNPVMRSGSLKKYRLGFDDIEGTIKIASHAEWDAAEILTGITPTIAKPAPEARHIYTSVLTENRSLLTIPFLWKDLSIAQKALLDASPVTGSSDQLGEKRLNYLRGARLYELGNSGGIFPKRDRILGAIVHSPPVFVGPPSTSLQGAGYHAFHVANKERRAAVYVGAGDGMLHAFDALNGEEMFAYVPQTLFKNLSSLTRQDGAYRSFVDGVIAVAEARVGNEWKTVLASGMGGGAQGVFALDVTRPDQFEKGLGALWEFTDSDDADIGHVVGVPLIATFKIKVIKGTPSYRDFVVVAGGLNSYRDDGTGKFNLQAPGALFLLALDKAKSEPWKIGSNYFKFITPISDKTIANGLVAPTLTLANDGAVNYIYSGDLQGNVWRFDFNGSAPWANALAGSSGKPLFTAMDEQKNRQVIAQKVQIAYGPYGGYLLLFGTGKFMEAADLNGARFKTQTFYGILDALDGKAVTRNQLVERKLISAGASDGALEISGSALRYGAPNNSDRGWYFDFLDANKTGERSISSARISDGSLFFNTLIPDADPCQKHAARSYVLNVLTGLPAYANLTAYPASASIVNTPIVMAIVPDKPSRDVTGKRRVKKKLEVLDPVVGDQTGEKTNVPKVATEAVTVSGRLSWREIVNWVELRRSATKK